MEVKDVRGNGTYPHPRVFFAKSADLYENKRVEFLARAKEFGRV
jgi:hypothetical protein